MPETAQQPDSRRRLLILRRDGAPGEVEIEITEHRLAEARRLIAEVRHAREHGVRPRMCGHILLKSSLSVLGRGLPKRSRPDFSWPSRKFCAITAASSRMRRICEPMRRICKALRRGERNFVCGR